MRNNRLCLHKNSFKRHRPIHNWIDWIRKHSTKYSDEWEKKKKEKKIRVSIQNYAKATAHNFFSWWTLNNFVELRMCICVLEIPIQQLLCTILSYVNSNLTRKIKSVCKCVSPFLTHQLCKMKFILILATCFVQIYAL